MAKFNLENEMSFTRMDGALSRAPLMPRHLKKDASDGAINNSMNISVTSKTPMKLKNKFVSAQAKTPSTDAKKTPKSGVKHRTPGKAPKTPNGGDRFIPNRGNTQFELGHYKIMNEDEAEDKSLTPTQQEYQRVMSENLNGDIMNGKFISYKNMAPRAPEGYNNNLRVLYTSKSTVSAKKTMRSVPQVPERILDAPDILDDYYLNLLDWSVNNYLAVCLGSSVYLWNASSGDISQLCQLDNQEDYVGSVAWIKEGNYLAVGTSGGEVQLWDVEQNKKLRSMQSHAARVGSLAWNSYILSSGSRSGSIHHHDVRVANHHVGTMTGHAQEVCGLKWSPDGKYLASGGNDNILNVWAAAGGAHTTDTQPVYSFSQHQAAVKALAWCPWQAAVLASGGGTADRYIRFWNCNTGANINSIDTKSQVCALLWSTEHKELISSHGFAQNQLIIWKYPGMSKVAELTGHTARVLHLSMSPDGTTVVSAGADETLRLWKCFAVDEHKKKTFKSGSKMTAVSTFSSIR